MWRDYLQLHFIIFLWGFTAILGELIALNALEIVFYRTFIATIGTVILILLLQTRRRNQPQSQQRPPLLLPLKASGQIDWKYVGIFTGIGVIIGLHWLSFFGGVKVANVSVCLAGVATSSLWTAFLAPFFHRTKVKGYEVMLGLLVLLGLYVISYYGFVEENYMWGLGLGVLAGFLAALFSTINSLYAKKYHHYTITTYGMLGACLTSLTAMVMIEFSGQIDLTWITSDPSDWLWLLLLGGGCTVYAYSVAVELLRRISVFTMNLSINLEPLYGILLGVLIFKEHEQLTIQFYIGTAIVVSAVFLHSIFQHWEKLKVRLKSTLS